MTSVWTPMRRRRQDERGQALVEFAVIAPLFLMLVVGVIQFAVALNFWFDLQRLANQGARSAAVNCGSTGGTSQCGPGTTTLQNFLSAKTSGNPDGQVVSAGNTPSVEICYIVPPGSDPNTYKADAGDSVRVTMRDQYRLQAVVNLAKIDLVATATMRLEQKPTSAQLPPPTSASWCP